MGMQFSLLELLLLNINQFLLINPQNVFIILILMAMERLHYAFINYHFVGIHSTVCTLLDFNHLILLVTTCNR